MIKKFNLFEMIRPKNKRMAITFVIASTLVFCILGPIEIILGLAVLEQFIVLYALFVLSLIFIWKAGAEYLYNGCSV